MDIRGKTILLVEDEAIIALDEAQKLKDAGYSVIQAASGEAALRLACSEQGTIDLILMDIDLGKGMDGSEAARRILENRDLPIVFLSSHAEPEIVGKAEEITSYGYVTKNSGFIVLDASIKMAFKLFDAHRRELAKEKKLREKEELLNFAIDGSGAGLWNWQLETGETMYTTRWAEMLGYTLDELEPIGIETFRRLMNPEDIPRSDQITTNYLSGKIKSHEIEIRMLHKDGHWVWILDRGKATEWDASGKLIRMSGMHFDITDRKNAEDALRRRLLQKDNLIKELHHRIKNNLGVVTSLLGIELDGIPDTASREVFLDAISRIHSIEAIYEKLLATDDPSFLDLGRYIEDLSAAIVRTYTLATSRISLVTRVASIRFEPEKAMPLGLILNELLANAIKYAYPGDKRGEIRVSLEETDEITSLLVSDDGMGLPQGFDVGRAESVGLALVRQLAQQVDGSVSIESGTGRGTSVTVKIPHRL